MNADAERRLSQLLAARERGVFDDSEIVHQFGHIIATTDINEIFDRVPSELVACVKEAIVCHNQQEADNECLRPEGSPFDFPASYHHNVMTKFFDDRQFSSRRTLSVVCLPSFAVEWALELFQSRSKEFSLVLSVAEKQLWSSAEEVGVKRSESSISPTLAHGICEVWRMMLRRARHPESNGLGLDGVVYHFASYGHGMGNMAAQTWSPSANTSPGKLVSLSQLLYQYVAETEDRDILSNEIGHIIESLRSNF